jgi:hypothetical protein
MTDNNDPRNEGHTREWQDRARVVLDAKKDAKSEASPDQSPLPDEDAERNENVKNKEKENDPPY